MMDLSVEVNGPTGANATLLHWILPGLSSPNEATTALTSHEEAIAPYLAPGPPAGETHTYILSLYLEPAEFSVPADYIPYFANLTASIYNRVGFNLTSFAAKTRLGNPVAADWFLVSNTTTGAAATSSVTSATTSSPGTSASASSILGGSAVVRLQTACMVALVAAGIFWNIL
jgi:hypothetical protein